MQENPRWEAIMAMTAAVIIMLSSSSRPNGGTNSGCRTNK
jgi:hypothetical protein